MSINDVRPGTLLHASRVVGMWSMPPDRNISQPLQKIIRGTVLVLTVHQHARNQNSLCMFVLSCFECGWITVLKDDLSLRCVARSEMNS